MGDEAMPESSELTRTSVPAGVVGILEDDRLLAASLQELLGLHGLHAEPVATTAGAFLQAVELHPPAVALVDLVLGGGTGGLDVLRVLASSFPTVRAIAMSGRFGPGAMERSLQAGAWGFVEKGATDPTVLLRTIESAMAGARPAPQPERAAAGGENVHLGPHLEALTPREREVLEHIAGGEDNLKISALLGITQRTVKAHVTALYRKLGVENRVELAFAGLPLKALRTS